MNVPTGNTKQYQQVQQPDRREFDVPTARETKLSNKQEQLREHIRQGVRWIKNKFI
tara:strand:+ start:4052 stop:4219 length:168 start_codon:yes stop_codon:yes gene_type:complete